MKRVGCIVLLLVILAGALSFPGQAADLQTPGKSAVLMDVATGTVLYESNPHERLAPASVTKIMTMLLIMEAIDSGKISWDDMVTASEAASAKGGSQIYLKVGETMAVSDMVKSIAVSSANDCACAMAEHLAGSESAFVEQMNQRAKELGMDDTHFVNCTGLDDDPAAQEHRTCAYDIALMSRELLKNHPDITKFTTIWMDTVRNGAFGLSNTNKMVRFYSGCTGLKTGFTSGAGYCLSSSARRDGLELIAVVMGAETSKDRFSACKSMLDYGFSLLKCARICDSDGLVYDIPVSGGSAETVRAATVGEFAVTVPKDSRVTATVEARRFLWAPVRQGDYVGKVQICVDGRAVTSLELFACESCEEHGSVSIFDKIFGKN